jgi:SAM-dependent MidA family methyltransferase
MNTPLTEIITKQIERFGPLPVSEFITLCLLHPEHGYYTNGDALGVDGDFTTSPEISQMFGELLGLSLAQAWVDQGSPSQFLLAELGPGNGTLMADILRATKSVLGFHQAADIALIEASSSMKIRQQASLKSYDVQWYENFSALPNLPVFLIANEFFDCMPIRQFRRTENGWQEQMIGCDDNGLHFMLGKSTSPESFSVVSNAPKGDIVEVSNATVSFAHAISRHINELGGAAIIVDYGEWNSEGDTLQAIYKHKKVDPISHCGIADLTAHVSFENIHHAASNHALVSDMIPQGVLLERLGITQRAQALAARMHGDTLENHIAGHKRLTHPDEMGELFKAIAIVPNGKPLPAGF